MKSLNPCELIEENNTYKLKAKPNSDFICKYEEYVKESASLFYQIHEGDFTIQAKLTCLGSNDFDATFLMVQQDSRHWIKLAVELGVDQKYNVVSVISDKWSDDANGELLEGNCCWLRITRKNDFFGLHYSVDGKKWRFVRAFGFKLNKSIKAGFGIQSPKGNNCNGSIEKVSLSNSPVKNFRDGS